MNSHISTNYISHMLYKNQKQPLGVILEKTYSEICDQKPWKIPVKKFQNTYFSEQLFSKNTSSGCSFKPLMSSVTFLYPLKTSENLRFSDVFRGYKNLTLDINELERYCYDNVRKFEQKLSLHSHFFNF